MDPKCESYENVLQDMSIINHKLNTEKNENTSETYQRSDKMDLSSPHLDSSIQNSQEDSCTIDTETEPEESIMTPFEFFISLPKNVPDPGMCYLPPKLRSTPKFTLVLDMDETLVHSETTFQGHCNMIVNLESHGNPCSIYVKFRPYLFEFLQIVSQKFEVVAFTASQKSYADLVLKQIDPNRKLIKHRLYRESCHEIKGNYIKDLRVLGRDLKHVIIVDNSILSFAYQLDNGIPIISWLGDPNDTELNGLAGFLDQILMVDDIRTVLKSKYNLSRFN